MSTVVSADGTVIGYTVAGSGPPVILVDGALAYREFGPSKPLAKLLAPHFTVYSYDRRGRGESGEGSSPWSIEREVEDVAALIAVAGGNVFLYGISCGAALALEVARTLNGITKLALYEVPFVVDDSQPKENEADYLTRMDAMIAAGHPGEALKTFLRTAGWPAFLVTMLVFTPVWRKLTSIAHTIPNDLRCIADHLRGEPLPTDKWTPVTMPTLAMNGGTSPEFYANTMRELAKVLPNAEYRVLSGQAHMAKPDVLAPRLIEFFSRAQRTAGPIA